MYRSSRGVDLLRDVLDDCAGAGLLLGHHVLALAHLRVVLENIRTVARAADRDVLETPVTQDFGQPGVCGGDGHRSLEPSDVRLFDEGVSNRPSDVLEVVRTLAAHLRALTDQATHVDLE